MKVGETIHEQTMDLLASTSEQMAGTVKIKHPRCGKVVIRRQPSGAWRVDEVERPDKS